MTNSLIWLSTWPSQNSFEGLPSIPGIVAVLSGRRSDEVYYVTETQCLADAESLQCPLGNVSDLVSTLLPDYRVSYWPCPPDSVVLAHTPALAQQIQEELKPRLNGAIGTKPQTALPSGKVEATVEPTKSTKQEEILEIDL